jgi:dimethylaniline monooxygenase (N-oxide forming)
LENKKNVLHSSDFDDNSVAMGKRVVVVGGGKSGVDCAIQAAKAGASSVTLLLRETHWPTPQYIAGIIPFQHVFLSRLGQALVSTHTAPLPGTGFAINAFYNSLVGPMLMKPVFRAVEELFAFQFNLRGPLRPKEDVVKGFYDVGLILDNEFKNMRKSGELDLKIGTIDEFNENDQSLKLTDGSVLEGVDLIVSATGFHQDYSIFDEQMQEDIGCKNDDGLYLYRGILPESVSNLAFIGNVACASNILAAGLQSEWVARHWTGQLTAKHTTEEIQEDIEARKNWARSWINHSSVRSSCILLHQTHYHDQLVKDMGESPHRKMPNIFAEMFMPYEPADYKGIFSAHVKPI